MCRRSCYERHVQPTDGLTLALAPRYRGAPHTPRKSVVRNTQNACGFLPELAEAHRKSFTLDSWSILLQADLGMIGDIP
jgi:hypothetical protein